MDRLLPRLATRPRVETSNVMGACCGPARTNRTWLQLTFTVGVLVVLASTARAEPASSQLPKSMRAAAIDHAGGPEVLTLHTLPLPQVGTKDVLIAVRTAGVSVWDADVRQRLMYVSKPSFPLVMGTDGAGLVAAVGSTVTTFKVGSRNPGSPLWLTMPFRDRKRLSLRV